MQLRWAGFWSPSRACRSRLLRRPAPHRVRVLGRFCHSRRVLRRVLTLLPAPWLAAAHHQPMLSDRRCRRAQISTRCLPSACLTGWCVFLLSVPRAGTGMSPLVQGALWQVPVQLAAFPIDTLKTRLQIPFGAPGPYQGSPRAFAVRRVNALQPPFWAGVGASAVNQLPGFLIVYKVFENVREGLERRFPHASKISIDVGASMVGSAVGNVLWSTPCEVVKCTFQSGMYSASVKSAIRAIHKESGLRGFYQGCAAQVARDLPALTIIFGSYELLRDAYSSLAASKDTGPKSTRAQHARVDDSVLAQALMGGLSGALAAVLTNPLDVVRTQASSPNLSIDSAQTAVNNLPFSSEPDLLTSAIMCMQATMRTWGGQTASSSLSLLPRIYSEQGLRGLMAGSLARSAYMGLGAAAFFVAYENSLKSQMRQS